MKETKTGLKKLADEQKTDVYKAANLTLIKLCDVLSTIKRDKFELTIDTNQDNKVYRCKMVVTCKKK